MFKFCRWTSSLTIFRNKLCSAFFIVSFSTIQMAETKEPDFLKDSFTINRGEKDTLILQPSEDPTAQKHPKPSQKMLDAILCKLVRLRVLDDGKNSSGKPLLDGIKNTPGPKLSTTVVFDTSEKNILKEFSEHMRISQGSPIRLSVASSPTFELTLKDGRVILLGLAGWGYIRWKEWNGDGQLQNPKNFLDWLAIHGITGPSDDLEAHRQSELSIDKKTETALADFEQAMPKSMRKFFGALRPNRTTQLESFSERYAKIPKENRLQLAMAALKKEFPTDPQQVGALLEWSGKMKTNFSFQNFPVELLLEYPPNLILEMTKKTSTSSAQWVGVCRFYSDLNFRYKYPKGYKPLNKSLYQRIHSEVSKTGKNESDIESFEEAVKKWIQ